jgi:rfaE bifunctional protein kinase chain/domain
MTTAEILQRFSTLSVLVAGDICLDRWCTYDATTSEPSRETGIPRIGVVATQVTPGAGGTIANNLAALGAGRVAVLGVAGKDGFGWELRRALSERSIHSDLLIEVSEVQTFTYTKVINAETGLEDRPRLDFISVRPLPPAVERDVLSRLGDCFGSFDVVLVSDQAETSQGGVVTPAVRSLLADLASRHPEKVVWVDSRMRPELFRNVTLKPNRDEADAACARAFGERDYARLREHVQAPALVVTHGDKGALVITSAGQEWVLTEPVVNPVDICGAGDSFSAGAAMTLALTHSATRAARFGNLVASITIMKKGTGTASPEEVLEAERAHTRG